MKKLMMLLVIAGMLIGAGCGQGYWEKGEWEAKVAETAPNERMLEVALDRRIMLGMPAKLVRVVKGEPLRINRSVGSWGVHEQWVYPEWRWNGLYCYFENGLLTSWQD